jgi:uncharacterized protein (DUF885 family)
MLAFPLLLLVTVGAASGAAIDDFFERFTAEWVRADPELATWTQYFSGDAQDKLDGQLTPVRREARRARVEQARRGLGELRRIDRAKFTASQRVSARVLEWQLESMIQAAPFEEHRYVFNQGIGGFPASVVRFLTDTHPARNPRDIANYLSRLSQVAPQVDEAISQAREAAGRGIAPPRFILTATIGQIQRLAEPAPEASVLVASYEARLARAAAVSAEDRRKFRQEAAKMVADSVLPSFRRAIALLEEQRKTATDDAGLSRLPDGAAAYASRLRTYTSTTLTADQIHRTGLEKVAQLEGAMDKLLRELGYNEGSVKDRFRKAQDDHSYPDRPDVRTAILADYDKMILDAMARSRALFDLLPKAPVVVRRIPEYAERNAAANYSTPARDGSRPGTFNVPLVGPRFSRLGMRTLAHHEAIPGHHFQLALQQEDRDLPRFRSDRVIGGGTSAFTEGWGLYAEALALENGWYDNDLPSKLGALEAQLFRARRLVVDTGLHTKGWTRQQAIDYGISVSETERYVSTPGQACAYMIGQLKILEVRDRARRELGDKFSLPEFHNVVLKTGAVPLEVLEEAVNEYIAAKKPKA